MRPVKSALTTPEAPDLHALFAVMRELGVEVCAMEVSSHAIVMGRVDGVVFDLAVFTNFGRDHLDFHPTVEDYFAAKAQLFTPARARRALVNLDDAEVAQLAEHPQIPTRTFAVDAAADWRCHDVTATAGGSTFALDGPEDSTCGEHRLAGAFNVVNAVTAITAIAEVGLDAEAAAEGIGAGPRCPAGWSRSSPGRASPSSSTTPTSRTPSPRRSTRCVRSRRDG